MQDYSMLPDLLPGQDQATNLVNLIFRQLRVHGQAEDFPANPLRNGQAGFIQTQPIAVGRLQMDRLRIVGDCAYVVSLQIGAQLIPS